MKTKYHLYYEHKKGYTEYLTDFDDKDEAESFLNKLDTENPQTYYWIEEELIPPVTWTGINDGYGIVGYGWTCTLCEETHTFVIPEAGTEYYCKACEQEHYNLWEEW